jgi:hypothetical protein
LFAALTGRSGHSRTVRLGWRLAYSLGLQVLMCTPDIQISPDRAVAGVEGEVGAVEHLGRPADVE